MHDINIADKTPAAQHTSNNSKQARLSVIIITCNSATTLAACLQAVKEIAAEIIILDSGSTDATAAIAQQYTNKYYQTDWPGYGKQKQRALDKASGDWVLSIDADEVITAELAAQIKQSINNKNNQYNAYRIRQRYYFQQQEIKRGPSNKYCLRLFKREYARFSADTIHEKIQIKEEKIGILDAAFKHYSVNSMQQWFEKINSYSSLSANSKRQLGKKSGLAKAIISAAYMFTRCYFFKLGILDGKIGFVYASNAAISSYIKYLKLYYDQPENIEAPHAN